jgi:cation diffusion facilitator family transporter
MLNQASSIKTVAEKEKQSAAGSSVLSAVFLTAMKLIVGLMTGSLGILAEAAHSGLDLVAAIITFLAVRVSDRPADEDHPYGHGKIENFSALVETLLLLMTCIWIIYESIQRLFFQVVEIDASIWAFLTMGLSIAVDVHRSRMLYTVAHKHNSQALEADALHFSTDIWSSSVVLVGLALVWLGNRVFPAYAELLTKADTIAALGVAFIVVFVSYKLGKSTIDVLLDRAPDGLRQQISEAAGQVEGVLNTSRVRVRRAGPGVFVDMTVDVSRNLPFERTHAIADAVEAQVKLIAPGADVHVHMDPREDDRENMAERIRTVVSKNQLAAHNISVKESNGQLYVDLHLEVYDHLSLRLAHEMASRIEKELHADIPGISQVNTHIEAMENIIDNGLDVTTHESDLVQKIIATTNEIVGQTCCHDVVIHRQGDWLAVTMHCTLEDDLSINQVHDITTLIENRLRERIPFLKHVLVHAEPQG